MILRQTLFNSIYKVFPGETIVYSLDNKKVTSISELIYDKPKSFENTLANIFIKNFNKL